MKQTVGHFLRTLTCNLSGMFSSPDLSLCCIYEYCRYAIAQQRICLKDSVFIILEANKDLHATWIAAHNASEENGFF